MNVILLAAAVLCLCVPSGAYARQLAGADFTKPCGGGVKTCHLVSNDNGATWVGPFCGPCVENPRNAKANGGDTTVAGLRGQGYTEQTGDSIAIMSANGTRTFKPGEKLPQLMGGDQVSVGAGLSGKFEFQVQSPDLCKVTAAPGAVFRLKYAGATDGWVLESISMPIAVKTKDGDTSLTPGRVIRITNIRANASAGSDQITINHAPSSSSAGMEGAALTHPTSTVITASGRAYTNVGLGSAATSTPTLSRGGRANTGGAEQRAIETTTLTAAASSTLRYVRPAPVAPIVSSTLMLAGKVTNDREKRTTAAPGGEGESPAIFDRWGEQKSAGGDKGISIDIKDYETAAKRTLQELADAYSAKRRTTFMRLVSPDFSGDVSTFEEALVRDFHDYRTVNLSLTPDRVLVQGETASVEFHYNLTVIGDQGASRTFSGRSNYTFRQEDGKVRLYKMEKPIIFGNSLPASENPMDAGQHSLTAAGSAAPGAQDVVRDSAMIAAVCIAPAAAFRFADQSTTYSTGGPDRSADIYRNAGGGITALSGGAIALIGNCSLESVTSVPGVITGISTPAIPVAGECYAVKTSAGRYAVMRITALGSFGGCGLDFTYKYQPNGSNVF